MKTEIYRNLLTELLKNKLQVSNAGSQLIVHSLLQFTRNNFSHTARLGDRFLLDCRERALQQFEVRAGEAHQTVEEHIETLKQKIAPKPHTLTPPIQPKKKNCCRS